MEKQIEILQQQLEQQDKLASLGTLSAGIAHEIQNPLNFVINFSKLSGKLLDDLSDIVDDNADKLSEDDREEAEDIMADLRENLGKITEHGERAVSIIQDILLVSRGKDNEFLPTDICKLVKEYVWLSYHALRARHKNFNISIQEDYHELPKIMVIPHELSRAVLNLVNNACYAVWQKAQTELNGYTPTIKISISSHEGNAVITIGDNGGGMTDEVKQRLFENFFTTTPVGEGTGLGMGITREIIEEHHGGHLTFESEYGQGTSFTITLPIKNQ